LLNVTARLLPLVATNCAHGIENLIGLWLGHARTLTDRYAAQLQNDVQYRAEWCERAGLGFSVVTLLHTNVVLIDAERVA